MTVSMTVIGIPEAKRFLKKKNKRVDKLAQLGLSKAAIHIQGEVKMSIAGQRPEIKSVDTGRFLNSIDFSVGKFDATIFSKLSYAKFLEFGTSRFRGRKHFRNTKAREQSKAVRIVNKEIKNI